ncbi:UNVERIFIED_CONTAM: hypothetical protein GTU68_052126 [Idotea baltica]|nr:hypothetical protein [Idotea baltica]
MLWIKTPKRLIVSLILGTILSITPFLTRASTPIVVSSKSDTEGSVLGQIIVLVLKHNGLDVTQRLQLGGTGLLRQALLSDEIDIYPEYTGNGLYFLGNTSLSSSRKPNKIYQYVKKYDFKKNKLVWLQPAPANNTWGISIRNDLASKNHIKTLSDLAKYINNGGPIKLAASAEFVERSYALPSFQKKYHFFLKPAQLVILSGGNTAATLQAASLGTSGVNTAMSYTTDGSLQALNLRLLKDNKQTQPIYQPSPVIRQEVLTAHPNIQKQLNRVFKQLNTKALQKLNCQVSVYGLNPQVAAQQFLEKIGY